MMEQDNPYLLDYSQLAVGSKEEHTMKITLSPVRGNAPITLEKQGDTLIVNSEAFDFAFLAEGDTLPRDAVTADWLASDVTRIKGDLNMTVVLPHGANAPQETRFPDLITATEDGAITLPIYEEPPIDETPPIDEEPPIDETPPEADQ
jgi:hypothetical protein